LFVPAAGMGGGVNKARDLADGNARAQRQVEDSTWIDSLARVGVVVYGLVHLLVAWLVVRLAFGDSSGSASGSGALHALAGTGIGRISLYGVSAGFLALVVWQGLEASFGYRRDAFRKRIGNRLLSAAKVVIFGAIGVNAFKLAVGAGGSSRGTDGVTARVMAMPAGQLIVGAVGVVIIVIAVGIAYYGLAQNFRDTMTAEGETGPSGRAYRTLGTVGYVSKAVAIALVGGLFLYAAVSHDPQKSGGLDQALHEVLQEPFGSPALIIVALGLTCFGLFCFALARHLDR
jgi:hypothetical protein